jgi:hypothetical protein
MGGWQLWRSNGRRMRRDAKESFSSLMLAAGHIRPTFAVHTGNETREVGNPLGCGCALHSALCTFFHRSLNHDAWEPMKNSWCVRMQGNACLYRTIRSLLFKDYPVGEEDNALTRAVDLLTWVLTGGRRLAIAILGRISHRFDLQVRLRSTQRCFAYFMCWLVGSMLAMACRSHHAGARPSLRTSCSASFKLSYAKDNFQFRLIAFSISAASAAQLDRRCLKFCPFRTTTFPTDMAPPVLSQQTQRSFVKSLASASPSVNGGLT